MLAGLELSGTSSAVKRVGPELVRRWGQVTCENSPGRDWIGRRTGGDLDGVLVSAEGTGSYGALLGDVLEEAGYRVVEAPTPRRERGRAKTDTLDAVLAARSTLVMPLAHLRDRRAGEVQVALQVLTVARDQLIADRLQCINALTALVRSHDFGVDARRALTAPRSLRSLAGVVVTNRSQWRPHAPKPFAWPSGFSSSMRNWPTTVTYRCRLRYGRAVPEELSNHPSNIYIREDAVMASVDRWLATELNDPDWIASAAGPDAAEVARAEALRERVAFFKGKIANLVAAVEGADAAPDVLIEQLSTRTHERDRLRGELARLAARESIAAAEVEELIDYVGGLASALREATDEEKADLYQELALI